MSTPALRGFALASRAHGAALRRGLALGLCGLALIACSREPDLDEVFAPPRPIRAAAAPERPPAIRYDFAAGSEIEFRMGPRSERVRGRLQLQGGGLTVDAFDLALTRGHATLDLRSIELESDAPAGVRNAVETSMQAAGSLTERALDWLELRGSAASASRPDYRYGRFALTSVGGLSAPSAFEGELLRSDPPRVRRRTRLDASGELELHGVRFPYTARVDVIFEWNEAGAALLPGVLPDTAQNPSRIEIVTREAVSVDPGVHAIVPRRPSGEVDAEALAELRKGSGQPLWVTAHWIAVPAVVAAQP